MMLQHVIYVTLLKLNYLQIIKDVTIKYKDVTKSMLVYLIVNSLIDLDVYFKIIVDMNSMLWHTSCVVRE